MMVSCGGIYFSDFLFIYLVFKVGVINFMWFIVLILKQKDGICIYIICFGIVWINFLFVLEWEVFLVSFFILVFKIVFMVVMFE